ncbi:MAG: hypothetical protein KDI88_03005 [Gammaproteobacteria bacterium]|nr:hypothetical protein [Gammaproteobacteria bacterium]
MTNRYLLFWLLPLSLVLAGCQSSSTVRESAGGPFVGLQNATVVLKRDIVIPPRQSRVFLQDGGLATGGAILSGSFDSYRPHCAFEIKTVDHDGFPVNATTFAVTRVQRTTTQIVSNSRMLVAAVGSINGGSASYYDGYHFWLASDVEPEVRRMTCYGVFAQPFELFPPTIEEINAAIRGVAELRY